MTREQRNLFYEWCGKHPVCNGCKFNGSDCVATLSNHNDETYGEWIDKMERLIKIELEQPAT